MRYLTIKASESLLKQLNGKLTFIMETPEPCRVWILKDITHGKQVKSPATECLILASQKLIAIYEQQFETRRGLSSEALRHYSEKLKKAKEQLATYLELKNVFETNEVVQCQ